MTADKQHWDSVYGARAEDELTWFEMTPRDVIGICQKASSD